MTHEDLLARITIDPEVCHGKPCIRGHRIWVGSILGTLEGGMSEREILDEYPSLAVDDIRACLAFGVRDDISGAPEQARAVRAIRS